jgi:hypothetical protein
MSQDTIDLVKAMLAIFIVFALSTLAMLYLLVAYRIFGGNLPVIGSLPGYQPDAAVPMLMETRFLVTLGATLLMGSGLALILTSVTLDMAILIFAKAMTLLVTAMFAMIAGHWAYMRLSSGSELALPGLNRLGIALIVFFLLASVLRLATFRAWGIGRFIAAAGMIVLAPVLMVSL